MTNTSDQNSTAADHHSHESHSWNPQVLDAVFHSAHTTNVFTDDDVDPAIIKQVYEIIRLAPTMMNAQPMRLTVVNSEAARKRLVPAMNRGNQDKTQNAPLTVIAAADPDWHTHIDMLSQRGMDHAEATAATADAEPSERFTKLDSDDEFRLTAAINSTHLQIGYLIMGLRARGLAVGPMTGFDAAKIDEEFHAGNGWKTQMVLNIGWEAHPEDPKAVGPRAPRLHTEQIWQVL